MKILKLMSILLGLLFCLNAPLLAMQIEGDLPDFYSIGRGKGPSLGPTGPQGPTGPTGPQGSPGQTGCSNYGSFYYNYFAPAPNTVIPFTESFVEPKGITNEKRVFTVADEGVYEIIFGGESDDNSGYTLFLEINGVPVSQPGTTAIVNQSYHSGSTTSLQALHAGYTVSLTTPLGSALIKVFITIKKIA